ncbi:MAG: OmpA family protein [Chitinophagaceae bacterium]|nr:OmpA family protein [Chitinophagaceae bacterium]
MAELRVERKKRPNYTAWLLLLSGLVALVLFVVCRTHPAQIALHTAKDTSLSEALPMQPAVAATGVETITSSDGWGNVDRYGKSLNYAELKGNKHVQVRGNEHYAVYDLGEDLLFDENKSNIRPDAARQLAIIARSLEQHFKGGPIRLFGFTDTQGDAARNKQLAKQRAEAVKDWLIHTGHLSADRMTIDAIGEGFPKASNATAAGRKENRRVQIVVKESTTKR